jgi:hypothetical protein
MTMMTAEQKEFFRDRGARGFNLLSVEGQANAGAEVIEDMRDMFLDEDQQEKLKDLIEAAIERQLAEGHGR